MFYIYFLSLNISFHNIIKVYTFKPEIKTPKERENAITKLASIVSEKRKILSENNLPVDELFSKMEEKSSRVQLKNNIEAALGKEDFGVPTFLIDEEMFWGNDSIKYLEMYLTDKDPLDLDKYNNFLSKHQF